MANITWLPSRRTSSTPSTPITRRRTTRRVSSNSHSLRRLVAKYIVGIVVLIANVTVIEKFAFDTHHKEEEILIPPASSGGGKFLTIITGVSGNHIELLFTNILATIQWRIVDRLSESYFDHLRVIIYDLDVDESTKSKNKERISNIPFAEYRSFDYSRYPIHFNINDLNRGMYAWKPTIIEEMVREEQAYNNEREVNLVYWIDSGLVVSTKCEDFDTDVEHCLQHGIYTPRNGLLKDSCHKGTADYLNLTSEELYMNSPGVSAGIFLVDVKNKTVYDRIVKPWVDCAMVEDCIGPTGTSIANKNHNYDQGALSALLAKHSIQLTTKPGERIWYGKGSASTTSCVIRGDERRGKVPNIEGMLFTKQKEKIVRDDNGTMNVQSYCRNQEWAKPGSVISCYERVLHTKGAYKMSDHDAKVLTLDEGCLCPP